MKKNQNGFSVVELIVILVVIGAIGALGFFAFGKMKDRQVGGSEKSSNSSGTSSNTSEVSWSFNGQKWEASSTPPACPSPLKFDKSPADVSEATSVLFPGQSRGGNYKPHGGLRFDDSSNAVDVIAPMEAQLVEGSRYIEQGEVQYMLRFTNSCGLSYRFDHLLKLSPAMQKVVDTLPQPKVNDSRTTPFNNSITVKAGDEIASEIGFKLNKNVGFDFGVYDLRSTNESAKDPSFVSRHQQFLGQAAYGVCWFDMLPSPDDQTVNNLPSGDMQNGKQSDYCK